MKAILLPLSYMLVATTGFNVTPRPLRLQSSIANDEMFRLSNDELNMEGGKKLGINFVSPMNEQERLSLREDVKHIIDEQVTKGLADLRKLREKWRREDHDSLEQAMIMNGMREAEELNMKVDAMVGKFLSETSESRQRTHHMAWVQEEMAKEEERDKKRKEIAKLEIKTWDDSNNEWDDWDDWKKTCN